MEEKKQQQPPKGKGKGKKQAGKAQGEQTGDKAVPWQQQKKHLREAGADRQQEIEKQIEDFALRSSEESLPFDPAIPSHERKWIHHFAELYGLCHESVGLGKQRHVKIWKAPPPTEWTVETLSISMKRRFVRDFGFHIKCFDVDDFNYLLDLYNPYYQTREKIQALISELKRVGGEAAFLQLYFGTKDKIIDDLKACEAYERFSADELVEYKIPEEERLPPSVYEPTNNGKYFLSLDIRDANFNALRLYDPQLTKGFTSWNSFLKDNHKVDSEYILSCKEFRSAVFHAVSSTALTTINNWRVFGFYKELLENGILEKETRCFHNNDELIIEMASPNLEEQQKMVHSIEGFLQTHTPKTVTANILRVEAFKLKIVPHCTKRSNHLTLYAKEMMDIKTGEITSVAFKGVPPTHFAVCFKTYYGMEITQQDLKFWNERTDKYEYLELA